MTRHMFKAVQDLKPDEDGYIIPKKGNLMRSRNTGDLINLVTYVSSVKWEVPMFCRDLVPFVWVTSVRYGCTNGGNFVLKKGKRSRNFKWSVTNIGYQNWEIVEEFQKTDNALLIKELLQELEGVDTAYKPPM
jgi:hypothetical protein